MNTVSTLEAGRVPIKAAARLRHKKAKTIPDQQSGLPWSWTLGGKQLPQIMLLASKAVLTEDNLRTTECPISK